MADDVLKRAFKIVSLLDGSQHYPTEVDQEKDVKEEIEEEDEEETKSDADEHFRKNEQSEEEDEIIREEIGEGYLELRSFEVLGKNGSMTLKQFKAMVKREQGMKGKQIRWKKLDSGEEDTEEDEEEYDDFSDVKSESKEEQEWDEENEEM